MRSWFCFCFGSRGKQGLGGFASYIQSLKFFAVHQCIPNSQCDQLPAGFIAQLVEHCTGIAEVLDSKPFQA